jgi:hypothetical protein
VNRSTVAFAALIAACAGGSARAHHSYAQYDRCAPVEIDGVIDSVVWQNPHALLFVTNGDAGPYRIEWSSMTQLARAGVEIGILKAGDRVVITGSLNRNPEIKTMTLLSEIRRPSDGWMWSRSREQICRSPTPSSSTR